MKKTQKEIDVEIKALEALIPIGIWARKTAETIQVQIDALKDEIDDTSDEYNDLTEEQQMAASDATNWANGDSDVKPSDDFGSLVK